MHGVAATASTKNVAVVPQSASQGVGAQAAIKNVYRVVTRKDVIQAIASEVELAAAGAAGVKVLQVSAQGQAADRDKSGVAATQDERVGAFV